MVWMPHGFDVLSALKDLDNKKLCRSLLGKSNDNLEDLESRMGFDSAIRVPIDILLVS